MKTKLFLLIFCLFVVTGCNNNKLVCEKKRKQAGYDYEEKYELLYDEKGKILKKMNLFITSKYNEYYTMEEIAEEFDIVIDRCAFYEANSDKIKCSPSLDNNKVNVDVVIKVEEVSDSFFENIMYVTKDDLNNLKEAKKILENVGYICK